MFGLILYNIINIFKKGEIEMNKGFGILIGVVVVILLIGMWGLGVSNNLVVMKEGIKQYEAEIDNQLKRRADLIPNLVNTVTGLKTHEQRLIDSVTSARSKMLQGSIQDRVAGNAELSRAINIMVEAYPVMKSDVAFVGLMDELSGTENRITVARGNYNKAAGQYNANIQTAPTNLIAGMFGHTRIEYLQVAETEKVVPKVEFK